MSSPACVRWATGPCGFDGKYSSPVRMRSRCRRASGGRAATARATTSGSPSNVVSCSARRGLVSPWESPPRPSTAVRRSATSACLTTAASGRRCCSSAAKCWVSSSGKTTQPSTSKARARSRSRATVSRTVAASDRSRSAIMSTGTGPATAITRVTATSSASIRGSARASESTPVSRWASSSRLAGVGSTSTSGRRLRTSGQLVGVEGGKVGAQRHAGHRTRYALGAFKGGSRTCTRTGRATGCAPCVGGPSLLRRRRCRLRYAASGAARSPVPSSFARFRPTQYLQAVWPEHWRMTPKVLSR